MTQKLITRIKRGPLEGVLFQEGNSFFVKVVKSGTGQLIKENTEPFYDQEEAEVMLGGMLDDAWREVSLVKNKTVRRM